MTVDQLIAEVLNNIRNHWYADRPRDFLRDERALTKAILRYGVECERRNWHLDAGFIFTEIITLLKQIRTSKADVRYLPVYLDGAIKRSIGQRAEELSAKAKTIRAQTTKAVAGLNRVEAIRQPTDVEICAAVFKSLKRARRGRATAKQTTLLL